MSGLANLKDLLKDERVWCVAARVALHDGQSSHYFVNAEGDYVVSVLTLQHEVPINANWVFQPGMYTLPDLNDEVILAFDHGDFEGEAYIVGRTHSGGGTQAGEAGNLAPNQRIMVGDRIENRADTKILLKAPAVEAVSTPGTGVATIKGPVYRPAEDTLFSAMNTMLTALSTAIATLAAATPTLTGTPPQIAAFAAAVSAVALAVAPLTAALSAFNAGSSTYLTTVFKAQ